MSKRPTKKTRPKPIEVRTLISFPEKTNGAITSLPELDRNAWTKCLAKGDGDSLANAICDYLNFFDKHQFNSYGMLDVHALDEFMALAYMFYTTNMSVSPKFYIPLISHGHILSCIAASSNWGTTDAILIPVLGMQSNSWRVMSVLNARNNIQVPAKDLFNADTRMASIWYNTYLLGVSQPTLTTQQNLLKHYRDVDARWSTMNPFISCVYFNATYFAPDDVRAIKAPLNAALKRIIAGTGFLNVTNNPDPKSIAIVSNKWHRNHAVYKSAGPLVEQLKGQYKLTLVHTLNEKQSTLMTDMFDTVCQMYFKENGELVIPPEVKNNDFQLIYYPDVGMTNESIWMSNARLAPIQVMGYGHPDTSGDNSEIDYIIGSADVESDAEQFYSEKMVRIPGLAQYPAWPTAERHGKRTPSDLVRINCVWGPDKYNFSMLSVLAEINRVVGGEVPHEYHFFASPGINRYGALVPFKREVMKLLGNVVVHNEEEYYDYMAAAEYHDFSINSFPFGGYNTCVESLYLGLPYTTLVGDRYYNRAGAWLLTKIGMTDLICASVKEFIHKTATLIKDREALEKYRQQLTDTDLRGILFNSPGTDFLKAIQHIIANHPLEKGLNIETDA